MLAGRKFAVPGTDIITPVTLIWILCQRMETSIQQGKVVVALLVPPAKTFNLDKMMTTPELLCWQERR
jgi:hypothetical protein